MNYGIIIKVTGYILLIEALLMVPSFMIAVYFGEPDAMPFLLCILVTALAGLICAVVKSTDKRIKTRDGLAIVVVGWLLASFFGSFPFFLSGSIPSFVDAFFETVSGFTTTGATILNDVEALPKGLMFWRSFTHWIGGMGILVFTIALLPAMGIGSFYIFKAETPGPTADKIMPRLSETAKTLYLVYLILTFIQIVLLKLGGMSLYDAALYTFGTVGTGGFSTKNAGVGAYDSVYLQMVIAFFMVLAGMNFSIYVNLLKGNLRDTFKSEELKLYLSIILTATVLIFGSLYFGKQENFGRALKDAFFQVSSIITTTGYTTVDFDLWPAFAKTVLFLLMFVGGCAGSTAGSIKVMRILVLVKVVKREIARIFHPRAMIQVKIGSRALPGETITGITGFFILYMLVFAAGVLVVSLEGLNMESTVSAVAATLGNIGPGFGAVGPMRNFSGFSNASKLMFSLLMLLGRLEIYTFLAFLAPRAWRE